MARANWFVALPVDPAGWFARVSAPPAGVRLFGSNDLHLTVAFLGAVDERAAKAAFEHARGWPVGAVEVSLGRVVPMGNPRRFSALSAELIAGKQRMAEGMTQVRDLMCDAAGVARESRPALPHITLARPQRKAGALERSAALAWAASLDLGMPQLRLDKIALFTWAPDRKRALFVTTDVLAL